jgi:hypothetical protein
MYLLTSLPKLCVQKHAIFMTINDVPCRFGHTHWYSRSCPVYKKQCQPPASDGSQTAPVHVNIGNAGASFSWDVVDPAVLTQDIYSAFAIQHGYLRVNASRTSLHIQVPCLFTVASCLVALCPCAICLSVYSPVEMLLGAFSVALEHA